MPLFNHLWTDLKQWLEEKKRFPPSTPFAPGSEWETRGMFLPSPLWRSDSLVHWLQPKKEIRRSYFARWRRFKRRRLLFRRPTSRDRLIFRRLVWLRVKDKPEPRCAMCERHLWMSEWYNSRSCKECSFVYPNNLTVMHVRWYRWHFEKWELGPPVIW